MLIVALAGGIGGSKLLLGLSRVMDPSSLVVVGNTGDDLEKWGLRICPDLDTVCYTLSGLVNPVTGWGREDDTFDWLQTLRSFSDDVWFRLGDRDLALHHFRSELLRKGVPLDQVTDRIRRSMGLSTRVIPMAQGYHPTLVHSSEGTLHLQEYLILHGCRPVVTSLEYQAIEEARMPEVMGDLVLRASAVLICPSNPLISILPILSVPGMRELLQESPAPVLAVSPLIGGEAIKGPTVQMMRQLGMEPSPLQVARLYGDILSGFLLDYRDGEVRSELEKLVPRVFVGDTLMTTLEDREKLAALTLELVCGLS